MHKIGHCFSLKSLPMVKKMSRWLFANNHLARRPKSEPKRFLKHTEQSGTWFSSAIVFCFLLPLQYRQRFPISILTYGIHVIYFAVCRHPIHRRKLARYVPYSHSMLAYYRIRSQFSSTTGFDLPLLLQTMFEVGTFRCVGSINLLGDSPPEPNTAIETTNLVIPSHCVATKKCPHTPFIIQAAY